MKRSHSEAFKFFCVQRQCTTASVHTQMPTYSTCLFSSTISIKLFCRKWSTETKEYDKPEFKTVNFNFDKIKYFVSLLYKMIPWYRNKNLKGAWCTWVIYNALPIAKKLKTASSKMTHRCHQLMEQNKIIGLTIFKQIINTCSTCRGKIERW